MIRHRSISIAVTALVVFFLTFLGMRIALLDKHAKPKPRPRAVLKQITKTAASVIKTEQHKYQPVYLFANLETIRPEVVQGLLTSKLPPAFVPCNPYETPNSRAPPALSDFSRS